VRQPAENTVRREFKIGVNKNSPAGDLRITAGITRYSHYSFLKNPQKCLEKET
jgi:hypothetical protein